MDHLILDTVYDANLTIEQNLFFSVCFSQNMFFRGRNTGEQDFSKSTHSNLLKLGIIVHKINGVCT